ncbi:MAG: hypothetical protein QOK49_3848 [Baekduia sp.]|jgi:hypothetical protein|nr:hypothetical protein [Baekduia sp.]
MNRSKTLPVVLKELSGVAERLTSQRLTSDKRMALLRRQAELGDLRDAISERMRRARQQ